MMVSFVGIIVVLFMLGLLVGGIVLILMSRGKGLGYPSCGACGYDLSGTIGSERRCPECGADFASAGIVPPTGKRRTGMLAAGIIMLAISVSCLGFGVLGSLVSYGSATTARQQAVFQQQQAAQAAVQEETIASLTGEVGVLEAQMSDLQQERRTLEAQAQAGELDEEAAMRLESLPVKIEELRAQIEGVRAKLTALKQEAGGAADESQ